MIIVGTSGWQYRDWAAVLYRGVAQRAWLERYASEFAAVELNNSFYRLPKRSAFEQWRGRTPDDFVFAAKMSRYLTHIRRLREPVEPVNRFLEAAGGLGPKLGPVLLQLPPTLRANPDELAAVLDAFPRRVRVAVEPRHESWWSEEIRRVLTERGAALCWADRGGRPITPPWRTADFGYLRMHVGRATPWPRYGRAALRSWMSRIADAWDDRHDVFVFFNNDPGGAAVRDAAAFAAVAEIAGRRVSRTPDRRTV